MSQYPKILIIAGEVSGDQHGAKLAEQIYQHYPDALLMGFGGECMQKAGVQILCSIEKLAVFGAIEVLRVLPYLLYQRFRLIRLIRQVPFDLVILVDYPGFNINIARHAKQFGRKVLYYISPKIWASRPKRLQKIVRHIDHMAVIFPFERSLYEQVACPVSYVGNPLMPLAAEDQHDQKLSLQLANKTGTTIAILPGSRVSEVKRMLPPMIEACQVLEKIYPNMRFVLAKVPSLADTLFDDWQTIATSSARYFQTNSGLAAIRQADLVLITSGTATLETALLEKPMVIGYRTNAITFWIAMKALITPWVGLPNILAQKTITPELLQSNMQTKCIVKEVKKLVENPQHYQNTIDDLRKIKQQLTQSVDISLIGLVKKLLAMPASGVEPPTY